MKSIIINGSSMVPIYEQIVEQVRTQIASGRLKENEVLPSVRTLARELKISALTVKKAYDSLEEQGFTVTVHGKGTYVIPGNTERIMEEQRREVETALENAVCLGINCGLSDEDIRKMLELIQEEQRDGKNWRD
ncbi:GntR family transcriptional regulator [Lachnoclostridium sp. An169]|uniref:GntR family transcriptional regulator n=1 Tax=Lachnoclostridium sp. An169 TaxID=1965569 RepID=UPI000B38A9D9|nr:GntR family transcriptional regulator [Lachnoclostridium sp. An169]OUP86249.1 GntR family transcriptional regulator [Lachnoclostridium sp. An169]HJA67625.1 GntR family transcriptional regulator [Candidatus Mediterraneibacter cottocaccae]